MDGPRSIRRLICAWPALASSFNYNNCHPRRNGKSLSGWTPRLVHKDIPSLPPAGRVRRRAKISRSWNASNCPTVKTFSEKNVSIFSSPQQQDKREAVVDGSEGKTLTGVADQMTRKIFIRRHPRARSNFFFLASPARLTDRCDSFRIRNTQKVVGTRPAADRRKYDRHPNAINPSKWLSFNDISSEILQIRWT